jgi:hypothetical protein
MTLCFVYFARDFSFRVCNALLIPVQRVEFARKTRGIRVNHAWNTRLKQSVINAILNIRFKRFNYFKLKNNLANFYHKRGPLRKKITKFFSLSNTIICTPIESPDSIIKINVAFKIILIDFFVKKQKTDFHVPSKNAFLKRPVFGPQNRNSALMTNI